MRVFLTGLCFIWLSILYVCAQSNVSPPEDESEQLRRRLSINIIPLVRERFRYDFLYRKQLGKGAYRVGTQFLLNNSERESLPNEETFFSRESESYNAELNLGYQWEMPLRNKFSLYVGVDLGIGYRSSSQFINRVNNMAGINRRSTEINQTSSESYSLNIYPLWGFQYHIFSNFSVGIEQRLLGQFEQRQTYQLIEDTTVALDTGDMIDTNRTELETVNSSWFVNGNLNSTGLVRLWATVYF
ncbi:MAG: hypothetical protein AAFP89_07005 [Bacteroidota bacterium]